MPVTETARYWAIVPAAGAGRRMGSDIPKQYLPLAGKTVLEHTLTKLAAIPGIEGIVVALSQGDPWWAELKLDLGVPLRVVDGGRERVHSVFNAVAEIFPELTDDDWLLVHDAARPCVHVDDMCRLIEAVADHPCGGILAAPARDTMKRAAADGNIAETVDRSTLWHALTPQLFRAGLLHEALMAGLEHPQRITDEASALELLGYSPLLVEAPMDNLKITRPEDLPLAEFYLQRELADG
jgi:2-C-methyl-D-erythritol 4-phosphate cytidylyltransferase